MYQRQPNSAYSHSAGSPLHKQQGESGRAFPGMLRAAGRRSGSPGVYRTHSALLPLFSSGRERREPHLLSCRLQRVPARGRGPGFQGGPAQLHGCRHRAERRTQLLHHRCGSHAGFGWQEGSGCPRVFCTSSAAFPSPSKPWPASPSAEQPRLAPGHADHSADPRKVLGNKGWGGFHDLGAVNGILGQAGLGGQRWSAQNLQQEAGESPGHGLTCKLSPQEEGRKQKCHQRAIFPTIAACCSTSGPQDGVCCPTGTTAHVQNQPSLLPKHPERDSPFPTAIGFSLCSARGQDAIHPCMG